MLPTRAGGGDERRHRSPSSSSSSSSSSSVGGYTALVVVALVLVSLLGIGYVEMAKREWRREYASANDREDVLGFLRQASEIVQAGLAEHDDDGTSSSVYSAVDTIFVSVASYRESECAATLLSLLRTAARPENVFFGVVQQNDPVRDRAIDCVDNYCAAAAKLSADDFYSLRDAPGAPAGSTNRWQRERRRALGWGDAAMAACPFGEQLRVRRVNNSEILMPSGARAIATTLMRREQFYMQIDAHSVGTHGWDEALVASLKAIDPALQPVLTQHPDVDKSVLHAERERRSTLAALERGQMNRAQAVHRALGETVNVVCSAYAERIGDDVPFFPRFVSDSVAVTGAPIPVIGAGAGLMFARRAMIEDVPYDPHLRTFNAEEFLYSMRLYTNGYSMFAPVRNVIGHRYVPAATEEYGRHNVWGDVGWKNVHRLEVGGSLRAGVILGIVDADKLDAHELAKRDVEKYGLGKVRSLKSYIELTGFAPGVAKFDESRVRDQCKALSRVTALATGRLPAAFYAEGRT